MHRRQSSQSDSVRAIRTAAILIACVFWPSIAWAQDNGTGAIPWRVFQVAGLAEVDGAGSGEPRVLRQGEDLIPPFSVRTAPTGRVTLLRADDVVHLQPASRVEMPVDRSDTFTEVIQSIGDAVFGVDKRPGREFKVTTPYLVTLVKGTVFEVSVADTGTSVSVSEELVEVASRGTGERVDVPAGKVAGLAAEPGASISIDDRPKTGAVAPPAPPPAQPVPAAASIQQAASPAAPANGVAPSQALESVAQETVNRAQESINRAQASNSRAQGRSRSRNRNEVGKNDRDSDDRSDSSSSNNGNSSANNANGNGGGNGNGK